MRPTRSCRSGATNAHKRVYSQRWIGTRQLEIMDRSRLNQSTVYANGHWWTMIWINNFERYDARLRCLPAERTTASGDKELISLIAASSAHVCRRASRKRLGASSYIQALVPLLPAVLVLTDSMKSLKNSSRQKGSRESR